MICLVYDTSTPLMSNVFAGACCLQLCACTGQAANWLLDNCTTWKAFAHVICLGRIIQTNNHAALTIHEWDTTVLGPTLPAAG